MLSLIPKRLLLRPYSFAECQLPTNTQKDMALNGFQGSGTGSQRLQELGLERLK